MTMRDILRDVASEHEMDPADVAGPRVFRRFTKVRHEAMWRMRQVRRADGSARYSLTQIGAVFGRHHATVLVAVRRYEGRL